MQQIRTNRKFKEWLDRYLVAELLGTAISLGFASFVFVRSHSYLAAAGAGLLGEGLGFYGYFIVSELRTNGRAYRSLPVFRRLFTIAAKSSGNLIVEFAPAEILDNIFVRPLLMYYVPQHLKPYAVGFIAGKLAADISFYALAIMGYELKKKLHKTAKHPEGP